MKRQMNIGGNIHKTHPITESPSLLYIIMLGTIVNSGAIILGSTLGLVFRKGISENYKDILLSGASLSVILIGIKSALGSDDLIVVLFSIIVGALIGEWVGIEKRLERFGNFLEKNISAKSADTSSISRGFVTASLVFCVGSMAIIGSLESGLTGNNQTLLAKAVLDCVLSIVFASAMGLGVIFSSVAVFFYQGTLTLAAASLKGLLVPETIAQMSSIGGLLILALGLNMLEITKIRVGNLLPGIFLPLIYFLFQHWI